MSSSIKLNPNTFNWNSIQYDQKLSTHNYKGKKKGSHEYSGLYASDGSQLMFEWTFDSDDVKTSFGLIYEGKGDDENDSKNDKYPDSIPKAGININVENKDNPTIAKIIKFFTEADESIKTSSKNKFKEIDTKFSGKYSSNKMKMNAKTKTTKTNKTENVEKNQQGF